MSHTQSVETSAISALLKYWETPQDPHHEVEDFGRMSIRLGLDGGSRQGLFFGSRGWRGRCGNQGPGRGRVGELEARELRSESVNRRIMERACFIEEVRQGLGAGQRDAPSPDEDNTKLYNAKQPKAYAKDRYSPHVANHIEMQSARGLIVFDR